MHRGKNGPLRSALGPCRSDWHAPETPGVSASLRKRPKCCVAANRRDVATYAAQQRPSLFDHLVGAAEQRGRQLEPERLSRFEINYQLEFDRKLHRKLARLLALEDAIGVARRATVTIETVVSVGQQPT